MEVRTFTPLMPLKVPLPLDEQSGRRSRNKMRLTAAVAAQAKSSAQALAFWSPQARIYVKFENSQRLSRRNLDL